MAFAARPPRSVGRGNLARQKGNAQPPWLRTTRLGASTVVAN